MSFGFGIGDILAVVELATKIRKEFANAPLQFKAISEEVKSLSILLQDTEVEITDRQFDTEQADKLDAIVQGSRSVLKDLKAFLDKHDGFEINEPLDPTLLRQSKRPGRLTRAWHRLSFDSAEVRDLRARVSSNTGMLQAFMDRGFRQTLVRQIDDQRKQQIMHWISADDHTAKQNDLIRRRQPGTRKWLLESSKWKTWLGGCAPGSTLYCPGIPGSGKTFTTAIAVEHLQKLAQKEPQMAVAYVFCDYQNHEDHVDELLLRSLLRMLLEHLHSIPSEIQENCRFSMERSHEPKREQVFNMLKTMALMKSRAVLVVDALDELPANNRESLVETLLQLQRETGFKLFFTSRKMKEISDSLPEALTIEVSATEDDVRRYLNSQMKVLPGFVRRNPELQVEIEEGIVQTVDGMFLLAELHLNSLKGKTSPTAIRKVLQRFSSGAASYEEAYKDAMKRVQCQVEDTSELAMHTLSFLACARRPLTSTELCHGLAIELDSACFDAENIPDIQDVVSACAGLILHEGESDIVSLVHKSTRDYFEKTKSRWFPDAELRMHGLCLIYINAARGNKLDYPFLDYAEKHWGYHGLQADKTQLSRNELGNNHHSESQIEVSSLKSKERAFAQLGLKQLAKELGAMEELLLWACEKNKQNIVEFLVSSNLYTRSTEGAATETEEGSDSLVTNDGVYKKDEFTGSTTVIAEVYPVSSTRDGPCIADESYNRKPAARRSLLNDALAVAVQSDNREITALLLAYGADLIATRNENGFTPLGVAAENGYASLLSQLLEHPAMEMTALNACQDRIYLREVYKQDRPEKYLDLCELLPDNKPIAAIPRTALALAASRGHAATLQLLLEWASDKVSAVASKASWKIACQNALLCAIIFQHEEIMQLLLNTIDINMISPTLGGCSPLQLAIILEREGAADVLSQHPLCNPNIKNNDGETALALVVLYGGKDCWPSRLVSRKDIDYLTLDRYGTTPIDLAIHGCRTWTLEQLLSRISNGINGTDKRGFNWLHKLLDTDHVQWYKDLYGGGTTERRPVDLILPKPTVEADPLQLLESLKILPNFRLRSCVCGVSTIFIAIATGIPGIIKRMLDVNPELIHETDASGKTTFAVAALNGNLDVMKLILDRLLDDRTGANELNRISDDGSSLLTYAVRSRHSFAVQLLLDRPELDESLITHYDNDGNSPLLLAAKLEARTPAQSWSDSICRALFLALEDGNMLQEVAKQEDKDGRSFLSYICEFTNAVFLHQILHESFSLRESIRRTDSRGRRMLSYAASVHGACFEDDYTTARFLLGSRVLSEVLVTHVDEMDDHGRTALSYAFSKACRLPLKPVIDLFISKHRANPFVPDLRGRSPITYAVMMGGMSRENEDLIMNLLKRGVGSRDLQHQDDKGRTILTYAALNGLDRIVSYMMEDLSDDIGLNLPDVNGQTPLAVCAAYQGGRNLHNTMAMLLEDPGIQPHIPDAKGRTPLLHLIEKLRAILISNDRVILGNLKDKRECSEILQLIRCLCGRVEPFNVITGHESLAPAYAAEELLYQLIDGLWQRAADSDVQDAAQKQTLCLQVEKKLVEMKERQAFANKGLAYSEGSFLREITSPIEFKFHSPIDALIKSWDMLTQDVFCAEL